jgi:phage gp46-like protein
MIDIALKQVNGELDIAFGDGDVDIESGLETAVLISLFSDARCLPEELPKGEPSRRGFWGDILEKNSRTGSSLWLLSRAKTTSETLEKLKESTKNALTWMVKDGLALSIEPFGEIVSSRQINFGVKISRPGRESIFDFLWSAEGIRYGIS